MRIYVPHARGFDFKEELYAPIRTSTLSQKHTIFLPHETHEQLVSSFDLIKSCDLLVAEVSHQSTGLGIELGWAHTLQKPIVALHRAGCVPSASIRLIAERVCAYTPDTLISIFESIVDNGSLLSPSISS